MCFRCAKLWPEVVLVYIQDFVVRSLRLYFVNVCIAFLFFLFLLLLLPFFCEWLLFTGGQAECPQYPFFCSQVFLSILRRYWEENFRLLSIYWISYLSLRVCYLVDVSPSTCFITSNPVCVETCQMLVKGQVGDN